MKLRWSKALPDKPGWWWRRFGDEVPAIVDIYRSESGPLFCGLCNIKFASDGWWAGPIEEPEEAE